MARPSRQICALSLLAALLPLTACGSEPDSGATEAGDVVDARAGVDTEGAAEGFLVVPSGRLDIRAGEPVTELPADATTERTARTAPDGGVFVPITWTFRTGRIDLLTAIFGRPQTIEMALVSDGKRYPLAAPTADRNGEAVDAYYTAVEGEGEDLELKLEYAGVTQTLDLVTGEQQTEGAQGLYDLAGVEYTGEKRKCPTEDWLEGEDPLVQVTFDCKHTDALSVPFVDGEWAPEGSTFVVIDLTTNLASYAVYAENGAAALYAATSSKELSELGGDGPTGVLEQETGLGGADTSFLVFTVEGKVPTTLDFKRSYELVRTAKQGEVDAPRTRTLTIGGPIPLGSTQG